MPLLCRDTPVCYWQISRPGPRSELSMPKYRNIPPRRAPVLYTSPESNAIVPLVNPNNILVASCGDCL